MLPSWGDEKSQNHRIVWVGRDLLRLVQCMDSSGIFARKNLMLAGQTSLQPLFQVYIACERWGVGWRSLKTFLDSEIQRE